MQADASANLYPVLATSYIRVALLSVRYLSEPSTGSQRAGLILIVAGIGLIVRCPQRSLPNPLTN